MSVSAQPRRRQRVGLARERLLRLWPLLPGGEERLADDDDPFEVGEHTAPEWLPTTLRGGRLGLDRWAVAALVGVAVLGLLVAGWFAWRGSATQDPVGHAALLTPGVSLGRTPGAGSGAAAPSPRSSAAVPLVVDVAGKVRRPGLVRVAAGSRVADALAAAGGALPGVDLASINLAALVTDGQQIVVGMAAGGVGSAGGAADGGAGGAASSTGPLDLNSATLEQLESLPGVGPVLAQRILDWRQAHDRFTDVGELREVGGIGERKFAEIGPKVRV